MATFSLALYGGGGGGRQNGKGDCKLSFTPMEKFYPGRAGGGGGCNKFLTRDFSIL